MTINFYTRGIALKRAALDKNDSSEDRRRSKELFNEALQITWPAFVELVMSTLFGMVDMIMVGWVSSSYIAAVGLTNQPFQLLIAVFAALNVGTTTLVAWNIGAHDLKRARMVTRQALTIGTSLGVIISVLGVITAKYIIKFMGAQPDTFGPATQYFKIVSSGLVFQVITMAVTAALRGAGETRIPMLYNVGANLFNVFGNYVLIYGKLGFPALGVAGAAISTDISRILACLTALYVLFFSRKTRLAITFKDNFHLDFSIIKQIFKIGIPAAGEQFILQSGLILFARTVSGLGTATYAAHQIGLNINGLTFSPSQAFGVAATTMVGQSIGANDTKKAEESANLIHKMGMCVACFVGLMFILFSHPIARLYTSDTNVTRMAGTVLKIMALAQPGQSTQLILAGALRGAGDTMYPLYASATGIWVFRVIMAYVFVYIFNWGLVGAWVAMVLDQYTRSLIVYLRYRSGKWKYVKSRVDMI